MPETKTKGCQTVTVAMKPIVDVMMMMVMVVMLMTAVVAIMIVLVIGVAVVTDDVQAGGQFHLGLEQAILNQTLP